MDRHSVRFGESEDWVNIVSPLKDSFILTPSNMLLWPTNPSLQENQLHLSIPPLQNFSQSTVPPNLDMPLYDKLGPVQGILGPWVYTSLACLWVWCHVYPHGCVHEDITTFIPYRPSLTLPPPYSPMANQARIALNLRYLSYFFGWNPQSNYTGTFQINHHLLTNAHSPLVTTTLDTIYWLLALL